MQGSGPCWCGGLNNGTKSVVDDDVLFMGQAHAALVFVAVIALRRGVQEMRLCGLLVCCLVARDAHSFASSPVCGRALLEVRLVV